MIPFEEQERLEEICSYINSNLAKDLSIKTLAVHFSMSASTLRRRFFEAFNITLSEYVLRVRMYAAFVLLNHKKRSINDVAKVIGYKDRSSFSRAISNYFGCAPYELLKVHPAHFILEMFEDIKANLSTIHNNLDELNISLNKTATNLNTSATNLDKSATQGI